MKSKTAMCAFIIVSAFAYLVSVPTFFADAAAVDLPIMHGEKTLATVNGDPITLKQFRRQSATIHEGATEKGRIGKTDPVVILDRMIKVRLVVQEATNMGLDTLPELLKLIEAHRASNLKRILFREHVRGIKKASPKEIDKVYKEIAKEIKVTSVVLDKEEDAGNILSEIKGGGDFTRLAGKAVEEGKGESSGEGGFVKVADLPPEAFRAISGLKVGEVSPVIKTGTKFTILKVAAFRYPENQEIRKEAAEEALQRKKNEALKKYVASLEKKYVKYEENTIKGLDFEAETPGFANLLLDERPVARISGERPVIVKDLAESLNKIFFHGIEQAIKQKRINAKKSQALDQIITNRVVLKEAKRKKIDRSEAFRESASDYAEEVLFGTFVQKAIDSESRATDEDMRAFLQEHLEEYTTPERIRLDLLVFKDKLEAEEAIAKLRGGADFQWMRANATGQAEPAAARDLLEVSGRLVPRSEIPKELAQSVLGSGKGDLRLHSNPKGLHCVISVQEIIPSRAAEFDAIKDSLSRRVYNEKRQKSLEGWVDKLRKASAVEIFAGNDQLKAILEEKAVRVQGKKRERTK